jgi:hypothetical protein
METTKNPGPFGWIEEAYGLMTTYEDFLKQYAKFVEEYPNFLSTFYEENPVMAGQYLFRDEKNRLQFMRYVQKHNLCASQQQIQEGQ